MRALLGIGFVIALAVAGLGCGGDDRSQAERDAEIQKVLQDAARKEGQLYEGMRKGVEEIEKKALEDKEKK
ncbi:MAG: hypothetical protein ACREP8_05740 [Candidatus Binatia bacterium]